MSVQEDPKGHEALKFEFTPLDPPRPEQAMENPMAKKSTWVPEVVEALKERFGEVVKEVHVYAGEHTVVVDRHEIVNVCRYLKESLGFSYLADLGGVDRFTEEDRFEVFYNLVSIEGGKRIRLKVRVDEHDPVVPSVVEVYPAANWNERECWDMFGIRFKGHPDLRRMYMPEDFEHHPLRKEFPPLGIPGSLPLPPQKPDGEQVYDPFARAHGNIPEE